MSTVTENSATTDAERDELRAALRDFLTDHAGETAVRTAAETDSGYDPALWRRLVEELGVAGLSIPGEFGGDGYGFAELAVVFSETGRALLPGPLFATIALATGALLASHDAAAQADLLPDLATGRRTATLAALDAAGRWGTDPATRATLRDGSWRVEGEKLFVVDGATADIVLVLADTEAGAALFDVDTGRLERTPMRTLDPTRRQARLRLDQTPARLVGEPGQGPAILDAVLTRASAALAAEQVGGMRACLEASVGYARERMQFGRPIGSFQAVKHKCADMFTRLQLADAAATEAADALAGGTGSANADLAASVAHVVCSEAYLFVAAENIQVHGGIGFTWEHPAHLYYRRAKSAQLLLGGPSAYYERMLQRAGVPAR